MIQRRRGPGSPGDGSASCVPRPPPRPGSAQGTPVFWSAEGAREAEALLFGLCFISPVLTREAARRGLQSTAAAPRGPASRPRGGPGACAACPACGPRVCVRRLLPLSPRCAFNAARAPCGAPRLRCSAVPRRGGSRPAAPWSDLRADGSPSPGRGAAGSGRLCPGPGGPHGSRGARARGGGARGADRLRTVRGCVAAAGGWRGPTLSSACFLRGVFFGTTSVQGLGPFLSELSVVLLLNRVLVFLPCLFLF